VREFGYQFDAQFYLDEAEMLNKAAKAISLKPISIANSAWLFAVHGDHRERYLWPRFIKNNIRDKGNIEFEPLGLL